jgi:chromosome segregation ATPase
MSIDATTNKINETVKLADEIGVLKAKLVEAEEKYDQLDKANDKLQTQYINAIGERNELKLTVERLTSNIKKLEEANAKLAQAEKTCEHRRKSLEEANNEAASLKHKNNDLEDRVAGLRAAIETKDKQLTKTEAQRDELADEVLILKQKRDGLCKQLADANAKLAQVQAPKDKTEAEVKADTYIARLKAGERLSFSNRNPSGVLWSKNIKYKDGKFLTVTDCPSYYDTWKEWSEDQVRNDIVYIIENINPELASYGYPTY